MLEVVGYVLGGLLVIAVVGLVLAARSHKRWLANQSPAGVWNGIDNDGGSILLAFDGGPHQGAYRQTTTHNDVQVREVGHWTASGNELRFLIMATDVPNHPRFGLDTVYHLSYSGPKQIVIDGPGRLNLKLEKAPEGTQVAINPFVQ
jgi:hypothetical protein